MGRYRRVNLVVFVLLPEDEVEDFEKSGGVYNHEHYEPPALVISCCVPKGEAFPDK